MVEYRGPARNPQDVLRAALESADLMHQVDAAIEEERRGVPAIPLRQVLEEQRRRRAG